MNPRIPHLKWHRVPQLSSEKRSIHYASLSAMFNPLRSISNQELFEKHLCNLCMHTKRKKWCHTPSYINYRLKSKYTLHFVVGYVQPITQQYKSRTVQKAPPPHLHYDKYRRFPLRREAIMCYCQIDTFRYQQR